MKWRDFITGGLRFYSEREHECIKKVDGPDSLINPKNLNLEYLKFKDLMQSFFSAWKKIYKKNLH